MEHARVSFENFVNNGGNHEMKVIVVTDKNVHKAARNAMAEQPKEVAGKKRAGLPKGSLLRF